jgi:hypothetical protein
MALLASDLLFMTAEKGSFWLYIIAKLLDDTTL